MSVYDRVMLETCEDTRMVLVHSIDKLFAWTVLDAALPLHIAVSF